MPNERVSFYSRLKPEDETHHTSPAYEPLQHNFDVKKLKRRCCYCIAAALLIAFVLWLFDPPTGQEAPRDPKNTNTQLKFVVVVHRHGARAAIKSYDFEEDIAWDVPSGKLLDAGFHQGFLLGRELRNRYWQALSSYFGSSVKSISTDVDRTVDTARSVLLGLLTDNETELGAANCACRPEGMTRSDASCVAQCIGVPSKKLPSVNIWDEKSGYDMILQQYSHCKGFDVHKQEVLGSVEYRNADKNLFPSQFEYVEEIIGGSRLCSKNGSDCHDLTLEGLENIWDSAQCLLAQTGNSTGPYTNVQEVYDRLLNSTTWLWHQKYSTEIGPKIGGILLHEIIENLKEGSELKSPASFRADQLSPPNKGHQMFLYSAHDSTLASLLAAMGVSDWHFPLFTSHIVFELYGPKDPTTKSRLDRHFVQIYYDKEQQLIKDCDQEFCPLMTFVESMKSRSRTKEDCQYIK